MSTSAPSDPAIDEVLHFWFEELQFDDWFRGSSKNDATITSRFAHLVEKARTTDELDNTWLSTPSGSLAMTILLDQFTRNIFRAGNHPEPGLSFSGDAKALRVASQSIAKGFDRQIEKEKADTPNGGKTYRYFFSLPFMHAEDLPSQVAGVSLAEVMAKECEILKLQKDLEGKQETENEKWLREWLVNQSVPIAVLHRNCVAELGRFPKRNEPLGREFTDAERKFLEEHPNGF